MRREVTPEEKEEAFNARVDGYNHQNDNSILGQFAGLIIILIECGLVLLPIVLAGLGISQRFTTGTVPTWCFWC